jgi:hypothetical protein
LRAEIEIFKNEKIKSAPELLDAEWIIDVAFLLDMISLPNELIIKLQGKRNFSLMYF